MVECSFHNGYPVPLLGLSNYAFIKALRFKAPIARWNIAPQLNGRPFSLFNRAPIAKELSKVFLFNLLYRHVCWFPLPRRLGCHFGGMLQHFGLPESKVFINSFIATVPVFVDSCIKFWIFNYLMRYSPSASAIYERMNT